MAVVREWPTLGAQVPPYIYQAAQGLAARQGTSTAQVVREGWAHLFESGWLKTPPEAATSAAAPGSG